MVITLPDKSAWTEPKSPAYRYETVRRALTSTGTSTIA